MNESVVDLTNITFEPVGLMKTQFEGFQNTVLTSKDILDICGAMDQNALIAAVLGVFLSLAYLLFVRRFRSKCKVHIQLLLDKAFLTMIAMLFVIIIVRLARGS